MRRTRLPANVYGTPVRIAADSAASGIAAEAGPPGIHLNKPKTSNENN